MRIELTSAFTTLAVSEGTLQNVSRLAQIELSSAQTENTGIVLNPGDILQFKSDVTLYARAVWKNAEPTEKVFLAHEPFKGKGEGGDNVLTYKGSVETYDDLPSVHNVGDVYNIETADETHGILEGDNVAWNGTSWDRLAGIYSIMQGATSSAAGKAGLAPAPAAGKHTSYLRGDGTYSLYGIGYSRRARHPFTLADLSAAVASGNYNEYDIALGDFYTGASGYTYIFSGANPMKGTYAGYPINNDHAGLIVDTHATCAWNDTNSTAGGYVGSKLHSYLVNTVLPKVKTDLGADHLYAHKKLYSTAVGTTLYNRYGSATGASNSWAWSDNQYISALTEMQVYGGTVWSSSGYDTGEADQQLEVFKHFKHTDIFGNEYPWLRDVVSSSHAALADYAGHAGYTGCSYAYFVAGLIAFH